MENFDDFLAAARQQIDAQRLLLVFAQIDATAEGDTSQGGFLTPKMCVDKTPQEVANFSDLAAEAANTGQAWDIMFAASLAGQGQQAPSSSDANKPLDAMIAGINSGMVQQYLAFNPQGDILLLTPDESR